MNNFIKEYPYKIEDEKIISKYEIIGNPIPQSRPIVTRKGVFYNKRNQNYKYHLREQMQAEILQNKQVLLENESVGLRVFFYRETKQRCDIDNLIKAIQDAGTGILWKDDSQICEVFGKKFYDSENPRAEILIYNSEMNGSVASIVTKSCLGCEKQIESHRSMINDRRFCSKECYSASHHKVIECRKCGTPFRAALSKIKNTKGFCSRECGINYYHEHRPDSSKNWLCLICGRQVSRKEYKRCKGCVIKERTKSISPYWENRIIQNNADENRILSGILS